MTSQVNAARGSTLSLYTPRNNGVNDGLRAANRYAIVVFWSDEDGAWVADVPALKSCAAFGDTREEAVAEVGIAIDAWLAAARRIGNSQAPVPASSRSGRIALQFPLPTRHCPAALQAGRRLAVERAVFTRDDVLVMFSSICVGCVP
jgi:predicted RNase H-like HicB family nuclease